jgi:hypothetical protein
MTRTIAALLILAIILFVVVISTREHRINGLTMPLLVTAKAQRETPMLYAPCPIAPRNFRSPSQRSA